MLRMPCVRYTKDAVHVLGVKGPSASATVYTISDGGVKGHNDRSVAADEFCIHQDSDITLTLFREENNYDRSVANNGLKLNDQLSAELNGSVVKMVLQGVKVQHNMENGDTFVHYNGKIISFYPSTDSVLLHSSWISAHVGYRTGRVRRGRQIVEIRGERMKIIHNNTHADFVLPYSKS
ncbi:unnamed protein product [Gongylonema pulchrum]|uniref:FHA domain-containing protein n=1 Tax=Gongylonema pulchrum TaxID=637853 RepID=A0A183DA81_9BILA|nr:unnamed protein product [Gongylonema pulchrum]